jgi:hypothetical protein
MQAAGTANALLTAYCLLKFVVVIVIVVIFFFDDV